MKLERNEPNDTRHDRNTESRDQNKELEHNREKSWKSESSQVSALLFLRSWLRRRFRRRLLSRIRQEPLELNLSFLYVCERDIAPLAHSTEDPVGLVEEVYGCVEFLVTRKSRIRTVSSATTESEMRWDIQQSGHRS